MNVILKNYSLKIQSNCQTPEHRVPEQLSRSGEWLRGTCFEKVRATLMLTMPVCNSVCEEGLEINQVPFLFFFLKMKMRFLATDRH